MFTKIHHIGVAVKDMDGAIALYESAGAKLLGREPSGDGRVDLSMLDLGGDLIEPIAPIEGESSVSRFIAKNGEGIHHVAYEVADIKAELARLKSEGFELIDEVPRPGFMGHIVAFIKPGSTMGTLWELVEAE
ncbi:MAG: VOC family protein [Nitrospinota bacterium]|jgi:methylmalonyl-CoA/ethylmalonyl-CoA epimerase|nr:VOC family protein [Nitrospinota bacterium]MDP6365275.1 VOC family protein [Nitrospinota bacterium]MDP7169299.1 VOC family protein [Nitrospinota bacterium]MDP7371900.1 VOC family protein [Nitrospinota bacterium]MDP7502749.1 VOC family protein [Nitrospinota bacterium]